MPIKPQSITLTAPANAVAQFGKVLSSKGGSLGVKTGADQPLEPIRIDTTLIQFSANTVSGVDCWRLVHDGVKVLSLHHSSGKTTTRNTLFAGTKEECDAEIVSLGLTALADPDLPDAGQISDRELLDAIKSDPALLRKAMRNVRLALAR